MEWAYLLKVDNIDMTDSLYRIGSRYTSDLGRGVYIRVCVESVLDTYSGVLVCYILLLL